MSVEFRVLKAFYYFFFFSRTATSEIYTVMNTLSLHDALPICGGEKSRLALVRLLLDPPNLLLMDEPTTHLDVGSIDALVGALKQYDGTLIFISHDVYFIRAVAKSVLHINVGQLTPYAGDYDYYLEKSRATSERGALVAGDKLQNAQPTNGAVARPAAAQALGLR